MRIEASEGYLEISEMIPNKDSYVLSIICGGNGGTTFKWTQKKAHAEAIIDVCRRAIELAEKYDVEKQTKGRWCCESRINGIDG